MSNRIHLIGIGGSGLSAIAKVLIENGYNVSGSDRARSPLMDEIERLGARVFIGHAAENIAGANLIVRSSAVPNDNPEVVAAHLAGVPVLKRSEFLGRLLAGKQTIAAAGTHGKTTVTSMIAWMLSRLGQDPSYIIGGVAKNLGSNAHAGEGGLFVIEADEYDRMFLGLNPEIAVVSYLEHDHPDCYPTYADYYQAFCAFVERLRPGGTLLASAGSTDAAGLVNCLPEGRRGFTYGLEPTADYQARPIAAAAEGGNAFEASFHGEPLCAVELLMPGEHNVRNALAALAVAHRLDLSLPAAAAALGEYLGSGRRFDVRGVAAGVTVIDDYAHHPTEIRATLQAARARFPRQRIWAVWQPHTFSRTRALLDAFAASFNAADCVIVSEIYAARESANGFSAQQVVDLMRHPCARYLPALSEITNHLLQELAPGDVLLVLSAGDADQVSAAVLAGLNLREVAHDQD